MAEFLPNDAQRSAINEEGTNILVSAGAGSGKTTVLVERILRMLIYEKADIDSFIVVTFTRSAAANMKEKIYRRIRKALEDDSFSEEQKEHLRHQMMRVFSAKISTIDSLCMDIVRAHFQYVDMDPGFRIADEAEIRLLKQDVLEELIEKHYTQATEDFLDFVEYYTDKNDARIEDIILTLYDYSQSHPDPERWILTSIWPYINAKKLGAEEGTPENRWLEELGSLLTAKERSLAGMAQQGLLLSQMAAGPEKYEPLFIQLQTGLAGLFGLPFDRKQEEIRNILSGLPARIPTISKKDGVDENLKTQAHDIYKEIKEELKDLSETFYYQPLEQMYLDMADCAKVAKTIAKLVLEYSRMLKAEKKARLIADFNDVAHFALGVLRKRDENGNVVFTAAADSIAQSTREIIVDEYQDTNRMQDALIEALSSARFGRPNVFMVGDVKQSIYGFRLACPDLFQEKYNTYDGTKENGTRIILGENYRSRKEIVDLINLVFEKIMLPDLGGLNYRDEHRMIAGGSYPALSKPEQAAAEILFINEKGNDGKTAESYEIARKIEEIMETYEVTDEDGTLRRARFSDIAILTRTSNHPVLEKMLTDRHIPVKKSSSKGFFAAFEIRLTLNLLRIIDNPFQDIPFAAVLLSPLTGLSANDLARIRTEETKEPFRLFPAVKNYAALHEDALAKALSELLEFLEQSRRRAEETGIRRFLEELLDASGIPDICTAMTYGEGRRANLEFLKNLADNFSKTSYSGLFQFIRYIEAIQKADMDFAGADVVFGEGDAVTMMTIHKSKGLEFPIVILADCAHQINDQDSKSPVLMDDELGIGLERRDVNTRIKKKTLMMETIRARKKRNLYAEEIRLLYVAMSRAKEKLILTGAMSIPQTKLNLWAFSKAEPDSASILKDNRYLYLIQDALKCTGPEEGRIFRRQITEMEEVETHRAFEMLDEAFLKEKTKEQIRKAAGTKAEEGLKKLAEEAGICLYEYPYLEATKTSVKVTASQMEKQYVEKETENEDPYRFRKHKDGGLSGAERGNAFHKVMELIDYGALEKLLEESGEDGSEAVFLSFAAQQIAQMQKSGHLSEEAAAAVEPLKIAAFLSSGIGERMRRAFLEGTLRREQQFVMQNTIDGNPEGLMQGIIDAFFTEENETGKHVVLVDYKTDRNSSEASFIERYQGQQEGYARACEAALDLPVAEMILYSFDLEKEIYLRG